MDTGIFGILSPAGAVRAEKMAKDRTNSFIIIID
jgi:hypothetical protein